MAISASGAGSGLTVHLTQSLDLRDDIKLEDIPGLTDRQKIPKVIDLVFPFGCNLQAGTRAHFRLVCGPDGIPHADTASIEVSVDGSIVQVIDKTNMKQSDQDRITAAASSSGRIRKRRSNTLSDLQQWYLYIMVFKAWKQ